MGRIDDMLDLRKKGELGGPKHLHVFAKNFKQGEVAEKIVATFLESEGWTVGTVDQTGGRNKDQGDLRIFREDQGDDSFGVEVKCDIMAERTGNFFIETAVEYDDHRGMTPGWACYTAAKFIAFYLPEENKILMTTTRALQSRLPEWQRRLRKRVAENKSGSKTWRGIGTLVPVEAVKALSREIYLTDDYRRDSR